MEPLPNVEMSPVPAGKGKTGMIGLSIVLLALGLVAGYVLGKGASEPAATPEVSPLIVISPIGTSRPSDSSIPVPSSWKTYSNANISLKYPSTLQRAQNDVNLLMSTSLNATNAYPTRDARSSTPTQDSLPSGAAVITYSTFGEKSDTMISNLREWRKNWVSNGAPTGLNATASYRDDALAGGFPALYETFSDQQTVYVGTNSGLILSFTIRSASAANQDLLNSVLATLIIK